MGSNQKKQKEDIEDMGSLSSPGTDTSGKARDKKNMEFLPGKKVKGQAWAKEDEHGLFQIQVGTNKCKLFINISWLASRWRSLSKLKLGYRNSSVGRNVLVAYLMEEID